MEVTVDNLTDKVKECLVELGLDADNINEIRAMTAEVEGWKSLTAANNTGDDFITFFSKKAISQCASEVQLLVESKIGESVAEAVKAFNDEIEDVKKNDKS